MGDGAARALRRQQGTRCAARSGNDAQAGDRQRASRGGARSGLRRILRGADQLRQSDDEREACRRADRLLGGGSDRRVLYAGQCRRPGTASQRGAARGKLHPEPGGSELLAVRGRIPSRADVETNPPGVLKAMLAKKVIPIVLDTEQEKKADAVFKELIAGRSR